MSTRPSVSLNPEVAAFARDVRRGLAHPGQKELPASYLYDELGSALFEAITLLPEYGVTRADARLLCRHSSQIARYLGEGVLVAELGSGSGTKTRHILEALGNHRTLHYYPIDVSSAALRACASELGPVATVHPVNATYLHGLRTAGKARRPGQSMLLLFLGSTIGNFNRSDGVAFLREVRTLLTPGDALLIGADLVKETPRMLAAYDDAIGVTAAFNRNLLSRMNRELDADFDIASFTHQVRWDDAERRIEMHLASTKPQQVDIPAAGVTITFEPGETIWTESSHKFDMPDLKRMASSAGFTQEACWTDREWPFAECLWRV